MYVYEKQEEENVSECCVSMCFYSFQTNKWKKKHFNIEYTIKNI